MRCVACGIEVFEETVCSCGASLLRRRTFTQLLSCRHCGSGLPWQGPLRSVRCAACQGDNPLSAQEVAAMLHTAARVKEKEKLQEHPCDVCGASIDLQTIPLGQQSNTPCAQCGTARIAYPPPAWLKHELPALELIVGGERDPADHPAGSEPVVASEPKPVALACPSCQAGLRVGSDRARTILCQFCNTSVYLPDKLWRVLHPVNRVQPWTIVFRGALEFRRKKIDVHEQARARERAWRERMLAEQKNESSK